MSARLLGPEDAALWAAFWAEALADAPWAFAARGEDAPVRTAAEIASIRAFVWEGPGPAGSDAGAVALACALWCRDTDPARDRRGWVEAVFVRPAARGRGIAARLIAALAADARAHGIEELWLEVGCDNLAARAAYARAGFAAAPEPASLPGETAMRLRLRG